MKRRYGVAIYGQYGFLDAFNPTLAVPPADKGLLHGRIIPGLCWVDKDYLGIDQGPIVLIWRIVSPSVHAKWRISAGSSAVAASTAQGAVPPRTARRSARSA